MKVYIAGALSTLATKKDSRTPSKVVTDYIQNVSAMCLVAGVVRQLRHHPYVPALDLLLGAVAGDWEEEDYRGIGIEFLKVCDAVLVISDSLGVQRELEVARRLHLPIYYNVKDLPDAAE